MYWIYDGDRFFSPRSIYDLGLPSYVDHLDDVFIWGKNEKTYFFYENLYWRYATKIINYCFQPFRLLSAFFRTFTFRSSHLENKNATRNFVKSNIYTFFLIRYDEYSKTMDPGYPQDIEKWKDVPRNIDAVFTSAFDGRTYFFKDQYFQTFDDSSVTASARQLINPFWFANCQD